MDARYSLKRKMTMQQLPCIKELKQFQILKITNSKQLPDTTVIVVINT